MEAGIDVEQMHALFKQLESLHLQIYEHQSLMEDRAKKSTYTIEDLVDLGYLSRITEELSDEVRKNSKKRRELMERMIVLTWTMRAQTATPLPLTMKATLASASDVRVKTIAQLPEAGEAGFKPLLASMGIPEEVINKGLVKLDWNSMVEHLTVLTEEGKPLPPGLGQTWKQYTCTFRKNRMKIEHED